LDIDDIYIASNSLMYYATASLLSIRTDVG